MFDYGQNKFPTLVKYLNTDDTVKFGVLNGHSLNGLLEILTWL